MEQDESKKQFIKPEDYARNAVNILKRWMKFHRLHRQLPLSIQLPQSTQIAFDSVPYIFLLHRIEGLTQPQNKDINLCFGIVANFFVYGDLPDPKNPKKGSSNKCFFGRTYESPRISIDFLPDGISYEHQPINIYYHTKIGGGVQSPLALILEIQIYEQGQGDVTLRRYPLGWIECSAVNPTSGPTKITIKRGSPRLLLN